VLPLRSDVLTPVFRGFTALGYARFFMLFLPLGYWLLDKRLFGRVGLVLLASGLLNSLLKELLQDPRPDSVPWLDDVDPTSFGMPSGHAQISVAVWGWIAVELRRPWVRTVCAIIVAGVCFSRLYLGVHDLEDVLAGMVLGLATVASMAWLRSAPIRSRLERAPWISAAAVVLYVALVLVTWPTASLTAPVTVGCMLVGFWVGVLLEPAYVGYERPDTPWRGALAALGGVALLLLLAGDVGATASGNAELPLAVVGLRMAAAGLFLSAGAPYLFTRVGLGGRRPRIPRFFHEGGMSRHPPALARERGPSVTGGPAARCDNDRPRTPGRSRPGRSKKGRDFR
jgi:glycerophosphoryl diester phosphodiesterase